MTPPVHARRSPPTVVPVARSVQVFLAEGRYHFGNYCPRGD